MNLNSHKSYIADLVEIALTKDKNDLIERFKIIINLCSSLFGKEQFVFWLRQLGQIYYDEIPITKFGLREALLSASRLRNLDRHSFKSSILSICERLFTYSNADQLCPQQTAFHYWYLDKNH